MILLLLAAQSAFVCTPTQVWDGDGPIHCAEGPRIRLAGIAARELDGSCRRGHPCPEASGIAARDALVRLLGGSRGQTRDGHRLVRGARLICQPFGTSYDRVNALCSAPRIGELNCAMVRTGTVLPWRSPGWPRVCTTTGR